jgi:alpha-tubulin suppressor-like RCC1 family protein
MALITGVLLAGCSTEQSLTSPRDLRTVDPKGSHDLIVSGGTLDLISVEVSGGGLKQPLLYNLAAGEKSAESLAMPAGNGYGLVVRGYDKDGNLTHATKLELESVRVGENARLDLALDPVAKGERLGVSMDLIGEPLSKESLRIVIRSDKKVAYDGDAVTFQATVLDANGKEVAIDPKDLHWAILDPRTGHRDPAMSNEMLMARYNVYGKEQGWLTIIAELQQWRSDYLQTRFADKWADVAAGGNVSCGLKQSGKLYCWGSNVTKMLGTTKDSTCGSYMCSSAPLLVQGGKLFSSVSVGTQHVCAVEASTGTPYCWGDNLFSVAGQPFPSVTSIATPTAVSGSAGAFKSVSAGTNHTCGVTVAGAAMCWGYYYGGRLGAGPVTTSQSSPIAVSPIAGGTQPTYVSVTAGMLYSCGLTTSMRILCWGMLGGQTSSVPVEAPLQNGATSWSSLSQGGTGNTVCATSSLTQAMCWGEGSSGQLGNNTSGAGTKSPTPVLVMNSSGAAFSPAIVTTATGDVHSCGLSAAGNAFCWGQAYEGELGNSSQVQSKTPVAAGAILFNKIAVGNAHTCALDKSSDIYCWGSNSLGQLGLGDRARALPTNSIPGVYTPTKIVAPVP